LDNAIAFLAANGLLDGRSIPQKLLLKLAACLHLRDWEEAGVNHLISRSLPSFEDAWKDFVTAPLSGDGRYPTLAERVFGLPLWHGAWRSPGVRADVMVSNLSPNDVVDDLADLLFQFRHMVDEHGPSGSEEDSNG
jgi:hypothetical protein